MKKSCTTQTPLDLFLQVEAVHTIAYFVHPPKTQGRQVASRRLLFVETWLLLLGREFHPHLKVVGYGEGIDKVRGFNAKIGHF